ncbi:unnamed protein product [Fusarium venenatum]|uniref:Uncharacterized protein n=1 Tax=Fusarium venenatum TaxID=56646 RepID=A0A2L2TW96_9HYPO|nr:uncharacterized protein FVRRES_08803 [Fusarium venenatum]CEI68726.1 unnamed protein product [Fusarium venenatum]
MCFGATCPTCSKKSWRGCGNHVQQVFNQVPESQWCTCTPRTKIGGKEYPPAAAMQIPGLSWISGMLGGGSHQDGQTLGMHLADKRPLNVMASNRASSHDVQLPRFKDEGR